MLRIHYGNRIEGLADVLAEELASRPPARALDPETIVIGHAGMDEWLKRALAERLGIAANLDFPQPASFVWRMLRARNANLESGSPLDRGPLAWRLYEAFGAPEQSAEVGNYLSGSDELARFELAEALARVFEQYQIYRHEWVLDWEARKATNPAEWQAALWQRVAQAAKPNPARLYRDFIAHADDLAENALPRRISVFGITALPPIYLHLLAALARTRELTFYVPNPCRAYWGDIESEKRLKRWELDAPERAEYATAGQPLLSALGTQTREFIELLNAVEGEVVGEEHFAAPAGESLLVRLQADMLDLVEEPQSRPVAGDDESVLIHVCHSRRREVEVLHDALLAAFERDPELGPEDILVMAPNMDDYSDHVAAVFGAAPAARHIPWSLAERSVRAEHPLAEAMMNLLGLPDSRLKASEVLGLLDLPAVARHYALDEEALENIRRWVAEAGVRWAWDGGHRERFELPVEPLFSWRFGFDRLLAGYALAPDDDSPWEGIAPWGALEGHAAQALGALCAFVADLNRWRKELGAARTPAEWVALWREVIGVFAPETPAETSAVSMLHQAATDVGNQTDLAGFGGEVPWTVARAAFAARLAVPRHPRPFLSGRVTFCALAPMRSIPAKFLWLLGMSETDFPRHGRAPSFDLIAPRRRLCDRSQGIEDRALFLDALCGARGSFQVSYVGRCERDNTELPASVVVNTLLDVVQRMGATRESVVVEHYLQPFSARYRKEPRREASYAEEWLGAPGPDVSKRVFAATLAPGTEDVDPHDITLAQLIAGLGNPARHYLTALGLARPHADDPVADEEPFALDDLGRWKIEDALLRRCIAADPHFDPKVCYPEFLARAWLPTGEAGRIVFDACVKRVKPVADAVRARTGRQAAEPRAVDLMLGEWHLHGTVMDVYPQAGLVRARAGKLRARDRLTLWVEHLALCATDKSLRESAFHADDMTLVLVPTDAAERKLESLCALYARSGSEPLALLPDLSFDYIEKSRDKKPADPLGSVRDRWRRWTEGDRYVHLRDGENFALAFRGVTEPIGEDFAELAEEVFGAIGGKEIKS